MKEQLAATHGTPERPAHERTAATRLQQSNRDTLSSAPLGQMSMGRTTDMPMSHSPALTDGPIQAKKGGGAEREQRQQDVDALRVASHPELGQDEFDLGGLGAGTVDPLDAIRGKSWMQDFNMGGDGEEGKTINLVEFIEGMSYFASGTEDKNALKAAEAYEMQDNKTPEAKNELIRSITQELSVKVLGNAKKVMPQDYGLRSVGDEKGAAIQGDAEHMRDGLQLKGVMAFSKHMNTLNQARGVLGDDVMHAGKDQYGGMMDGMSDFGNKLSSLQALQQNEEMYLKYGTDTSKMSRRDRLRHKSYHNNAQAYQAMTKGTSLFRGQ